MTDELERRVSELEVALRGDLKGTPGIGQNIVRLMEDFYVPPQGVSPRVKVLEDYVLKAQGAAWVGKALWSIALIVIGALIGLLIKK